MRHRSAWAVTTLAIGAALGAPSMARAAGDIGGELVFMNWESGAVFDVLKALEAGFTAHHPGLTIRNTNLTVQGDQRGAIRTALLGGETADLLENTWPAFRKELADSGTIRSVDAQWTAGRWGDNIPDVWRKLAQVDGKTYGVTYTFGDRSAIFYRPDTLKKAGLDAPPQTWDAFEASFPKLSGVGVTPVAVPAKVWAQAEWFESLLLRLGGAETAAKLGRHEIPWTDPIVKAAFKRYAEMLRAKCCGDASMMLATEWDNAAERVLKAKTAGYEQIGLWVNTIARNDYKLKEGVDYSIFQFPSLGAGHDDVTSVDTKEFVALTAGKNPAAADAFLAYLGTAEAADILARHGLTSASNKVDASLYGPVVKLAADAVSRSKVQFVLGDLLPGDVVDEYRVQIQRFLQDPSDAMIDSVTAAIEAKAADSQ